MISELIIKSFIYKREVFENTDYYVCRYCGGQCKFHKNVYAFTGIPEPRLALHLMECEEFRKYEGPMTENESTKV